MQPISREDMQALVGQELGVSRWFDVDQARIDTFAEVTEDRQFIHVDPEAAARTPFGGTIAHGFMNLSFLSAMGYDVVRPVEGVVMSLNYGFDKIRFVSPVRSGSRVRGRIVLKSMTDRGPTEFMTCLTVTVEVEGGQKPALVADWLGLFYTA